MIRHVLLFKIKNDKRLSERDDRDVFKARFEHSFARDKIKYWSGNIYAAPTYSGEGYPAPYWTNYTSAGSSTSYITYHTDNTSTGVKYGNH